jgi:hypothetical protein
MNDVSVAYMMPDSASRQNEERARLNRVRRRQAGEGGARKRARQAEDYVLRTS